MRYNKKEKIQQVNLKNQEVFKMSIANIPYNKSQLLKWSCFRVEKSEDYKKSYELIHTPLTELAKHSGYEKFKDKLNWLYNNYSAENYQRVWAELQDHNEQRKVSFIQKTIIDKADYILNKQIEGYKSLFGETEAWIEKLNDNQRAYLLDRAKVLYGLEPKEFELETKQLYTVPEHIVKDFREDGSAVYYSQEELQKVNKKVVKTHYQDIVGKVKVKSAVLQRLAENEVIQSAKWMSQFNDTENDLREHREVEDTSDFEERMQLAIEYVTEHKGEMPAKELVATAMYLYNIKPEEFNKNTMVPVRDMQGPDSPYGLEVELRDFLEPIYGEDEGL